MIEGTSLAMPADSILALQHIGDIGDIEDAELYTDWRLHRLKAISTGH